LTEFDEEPELSCALIFAELAGSDEGELTKLGCPVILAEVEEEDLSGIDRFRRKPAARRNALAATISLPCG
jgi:hypothetical protein